MTGLAVLLPLLVLVASCCGTWAVRRYALARDLIDVPNSRSSHKTPTPRGGGLPIAVLVPAALLVAWRVDLVSGPLAPALAISGALVALVGWIDDHGHVRASIRLGVQVTAAGLFVFMIGGMPELTLWPFVLPLGPAGSILAVIGIVWTTNLFNFMDGTDGLAGSQALVVGLVGATLAMAGGGSSIALASALCAAGAGGFLIWNWPPAKVFMGDVGSSFLGFAFGALSVASEASGTMSILIWIVLLGFFAFDSTVTLVRRLMRGERWYQAHRRHAFQRIVRMGRSHMWLLIRVWILNLCLSLVALGMYLWPRLGVPGVLLSVLILAVLYGAIERWAPMGSSGAAKSSASQSGDT